jgi:hypothetical protein
VLGFTVLMAVPVMAVLVIAFVSAVVTVSLGLAAGACTVMPLAMPVVPMLAVLLARSTLVVRALVSVAVVIFVVVTVVAVSVVLVVATPSGFDQVRRQELHTAPRAAVGFLARYLWMHGAHVSRLFCRLGEQLHAALRTAAGLVTDHLWVHRAGVNDRDAFGHAQVHLGDERECLVGRSVQERLDALA